MKVTIVGSGFVGLTSAVVYASKGHDIIALDIDERRVELLNQGISPIYEKGIDELLAEGLDSKKLEFTTNYEYAINNSDIIMLVVGTPSTENGDTDLTYIFESVDNILKVVNKDIVLVTKSTVPVGTNRKIMEQVAYSQYDIQVVSNPEFLAEGTAVKDTLGMSRVVVGSDNEEAMELVMDLHKGMSNEFLSTDLESAELIKQSSNAFLATKISFINGISQLSDHYGANVDEVARGMGLDPRISPKFLNAGVGFGGSCFPKDVRGLRHISKDVSDTFHDLLDAVLDTNDEMRYSIVDQLESMLGSTTGKRVAILGLSFKPSTNDIREAPSLSIIKQLLELGTHIYAYDPVVRKDDLPKELSEEIILTNSYEDALSDSDGCIIVTEWDEFKVIDESKFLELMKYPNVVDGRGIIDVTKSKELGINIYSIGR